MKTVLTLTMLMALLGGPSAAAVICPHIVAPVCGLQGSGRLQTYNNGCEATRAGATVLHSGKCNGTFCPNFCIVDHGVIGKSVKTGAIRHYLNMCWAEKGFAVFVGYGSCPRG